MIEVAKYKWQIVARLRRPDGSERVEDLGVHEASTGQRAKKKAIALHAGRMGWRGGKNGPITGKWTFRITSAKKELP